MGRENVSVGNPTQGGNQTNGQMVGGLVRWLAGWMVGWLSGWLADWLVAWLVGWQAGWLVGWSAASTDYKLIRSLDVSDAFRKHARGMQACRRPPRGSQEAHKRITRGS